jgi:hypothetical protein
MWFTDAVKIQWRPTGLHCTTGAKHTSLEKSQFHAVARSDNAMQDRSTRCVRSQQFLREGMYMIANYLPNYHSHLILQYKIVFEADDAVNTTTINYGSVEKFLVCSLGDEGMWGTLYILPCRPGEFRPRIRMKLTSHFDLISCHTPNCHCSHPKPFLGHISCRLQIPNTPHVGSYSARQLGEREEQLHAPHPTADPSSIPTTWTSIPCQVLRFDMRTADLLFV